MTQKVNELKRQGGYTVTDPERELKSPLDTAKTALKHRIADLKLQISARQKIVKTHTPLTVDQELTNLRAERDRLNKEFAAIFGRKELTDAERIKLAEKALDRSIEKMEADLKVGRLYPDTEGRKAAWSPAIAAKHAQLDALRATRQELRDIANPKLTEEEKANNRYESGLKRSLAYWTGVNEKYASGDFTPKPKKAERVPTQAQKDIAFERDRNHREADRRFEENRRALRSPVRKAFDAVAKIMNTSRTLIVSFDLPPMFRQGAALTASSPILSIRAMRQAFKAIGSEKGLYEVETELLKNPEVAAFVKRSKLDLSSTEGSVANKEEGYQDSWAGQLPLGIGKLVQMSERGYVAYMNVLRVLKALAMADNLGGVNGLTDPEARIIGNMVNVFSGRGDVGKLKAVAEETSIAFFAFRNAVSRFQMVLGQPFLKGAGKGSWRVRQAIAKEYAKSLIGITLFYGMTKLALTAMLGANPKDDEDKWSIKWNPFSGDILSHDLWKIRIGKTRLDPLGGISQATVFLARLATGKTKLPSGVIVPTRGEGRPYNSSDDWDIAGRFLRSKLSPVLGSVIDWTKGTDYLGKPVTKESIAANLSIPLVGRDILAAMKDQGVPRGTAMAMLTMFGMGSQSYDERMERAARDEMHVLTVGKAANRTPADLKRIAELKPKVYVEKYNEETDRKERDRLFMARVKDVLRDKPLNQGHLIRYRKSLEEWERDTDMSSQFLRELKLPEAETYDIGKRYFDALVDSEQMSPQTAQHNYDKMKAIFARDYKTKVIDAKVSGGRVPP